MEKSFSMRACVYFRSVKKASLRTGGRGHRVGRNAGSGVRTSIFKSHLPCLSCLVCEVGTKNSTGLEEPLGRLE